MAYFTSYQPRFVFSNPAESPISYYRCGTCRVSILYYVLLVVGHLRNLDPLFLIFVQSTVFAKWFLNGLFAVSHHNVVIYLNLKNFQYKYYRNNVSARSAFQTSQRQTSRSPVGPNKKFEPNEIHKVLSYFTVHCTHRNIETWAKIPNATMIPHEIFPTG